MARDAPSQERTLYLYLKNERTLRAGGSEARLLSELLFDAYEARAEAGRGNGASRPEITRDHPRLGVDEASQGQGGDEPGTGACAPPPPFSPSPLSRIDRLSRSLSPPDLPPPTLLRSQEGNQNTPTHTPSRAQRRPAQGKSTLRPMKMFTPVGEGEESTEAHPSSEPGGD